MKDRIAKVKATFPEKILSGILESGQRTGERFVQRNSTWVPTPKVRQSSLRFKEKMVGTGQEGTGWWEREGSSKPGAGSRRITGVQGLKGCLDHSKIVKIRAGAMARTAC